jgi:hypothetical protein
MPIFCNFLIKHSTRNISKFTPRGRITPMPNKDITMKGTRCLMKTDAKLFRKKLANNLKNM